MLFVSLSVRHQRQIVTNCNMLDHPCDKLAEIQDRELFERILGDGETLRNIL